MKKLLFITSRLLWPVDNGRKTSLNNYCRGLHEKFGYDIYLYCFNDSNQTYNGEIPEYIKEVRIAKEISTVEKIKNLLLLSFSTKQMPFQCSLYFSKANCNAISEYCNDIHPDVVFTEMIRTAIYYKYCNNVPILVSNMDDLLSKRYSRQSKVATENANIAGAYSSRIPAFLENIIRKTNLKKLILNLEAKRCEKWEKVFYKKYNYSLFTSPIEASEINSTMNDNKAMVLSVGVDYDDFSREMPELKVKKGSLSFVGNFKFAPNCEALHVMTESILPKLKNEYKLKVVGLCPENVREKYKENKNIEFTGRVDDLTAEVRSTEIFLSPITFGTGIKTKIVEAMAMGMPVITNEIGAEGIPYTNYENLIVENDYSKIAEAIDCLLEDESKRLMIGKNAQLLAYRNYRWELIFNTFEEINL